MFNEEALSYTADKSEFGFESERKQCENRSRS